MRWMLFELFFPHIICTFTFKITALHKHVPERIHLILGPRNWRPTLNISQIGVGVLGHIDSKLFVLLRL